MFHRTKFTQADFHQPLPLKRLRDITLTEVGHADDARRGHMCAMQAVQWLAHSYTGHFRPIGTTPTITNVVVMVNDGTTHEDRQRLIPWLPALVGLYPDEMTVLLAYEQAGIRCGDMASVQAIIEMIRILRPAYRPVSVNDPYVAVAPSAFTEEDEKFLHDVEKGKIRSKLSALVSALAIF